MGAPKLALPFEGSTILQTVLTKLVTGGCQRLRVVLGHHAELLQPLLTGHPAETVTNPNPEAGMLSSFQAGLRDIPADADPIVLHPGDMPFFDPLTLVMLLLAMGQAVGDDYLETQLDTTERVPPIEESAAGGTRSLVSAEGKQRRPRPDAAVPAIAGRRGHPLVLTRSAALKALALGPEAKMSDLLRDPTLTIVKVPCNDTGVLRDVDVPADLETR